MAPADVGSGSAPDHRLTVLTGPSGVGKGSVIQRIRRAHPEVWVSVSATTRAARPTERDGVDYFFVPRAEFERMAGNDELLEWAEYAGNLYGTPIAPIMHHLGAGIPVLLEVELQGARQVRDVMPDARFVFLAPPTWDELVIRLRGRGTEEPEVVRRRLDAARVELAAEDEFDVTLVNDSVETTAAELVALMAIT